MRIAPAVLITAVLAAGCADADFSDATPPTDIPTDGPTATVAPETTTTPSATPRLPWPTPFDDGHREWTVEIVDRLPHDPGAFTQGLEFGDEGLWESTGRYGQSTVRLTDPETGEIVARRDLAPEYFGEGLTVADGHLVQLTFRSGIALRYTTDLTELEPITYAGEGWGVCHDGTHLWTSDGSDTLTRRKLDFTVLERVTVTRAAQTVDQLNELECVGDHVMANVWKTDEILVIEPSSGEVRATIDASALRAEVQPTDAAAVLNGIADRGDGTLLLAGKLWPTTFVVELVETVSR